MGMSASTNLEESFKGLNAMENVFPFTRGGNVIKIYAIQVTLNVA